MKKLLKYGVVCLMTTLCACSDNDDFKSENSVPTGTGEMEVMTPDRQLQFIQQTAGMALQLLKPEEQEELLLNSAYALMAYGELKAPEAWRTMAEELVKAATVTIAGSGSAESRASFNVVNSVYFKDFAGKYTPSDSEWVKTGDSANIEFIFPGADGQEQSFIITGSDETFLYSFVSEKWEGNDVYYTSTAIYIPTTLTATYEVHGNSLASAKINYSVDAKKNGTYDINAQITATAANVSASATLLAQDRLLSANYDLDISGTNLLKGAIAAEGHDLTNLQHIMLLTKTEDVVMLVDEVESYVDILGRVQINSELETSRKFFDLKKPGKLTLTEADKESRRLVDLLEDKTETWIRFNGTKTKQSEIHWGPYTFELEEGWGYAATPLLYFPKADLTLTPQELLTAEMATAVKDLIAKYKAIFQH